MPEFSSVLAAWREIRLAGLQEELAGLAPRLADGQKEALLSRKNLADRTREFKRQSPESQLEGIRALLKAYQGEIDALTSRAKQAEGAVLDVQTRLGHAPDPYPVFEALVVRPHTHSGTNSVRTRYRAAAHRTC